MQGNGRCASSLAVVLPPPCRCCCVVNVCVWLALASLWWNNQMWVQELWMWVWLSIPVLFQLNKSALLSSCLSWSWSWSWSACFEVSSYLWLMLCKTGSVAHKSFLSRLLRPVAIWLLKVFRPHEAAADLLE